MFCALKDEAVAREKIARAQEELKKLKSAEKNVQKQRESAMKDMEKLVKDSQKVVNKVKSELVDAKHKRDIIAGEVESIQKEIISLTEQSAALEKSVQKTEAELEELNAKV